MKSKRIIGFLGEKNVGKSIAANTLKQMGYHRVSIQDKIAEFAAKLFSEDELQKDKETIFREIRERGNKAHKGYWLNLALISVPNTADKIVFEDLTVQDLIGDVVKCYQIYRPGISTHKLPNVETINNDKKLEDFISKVKSLAKK